MEPSTPVTGKFQQKFSLVTSVGNVPNLSRDEMPFSSSHVRLLLKPFHFAPKNEDIPLKSAPILASLSLISSSYFGPTPIHDQFIRPYQSLH
jgi:hypothetical protein